ncbi:hypothetical protein D9757_003273 [Collybiopsis confluens]|uniref:Protein kinase domain-containing protein n=1 Tax=Collybiopsis confluens TaxID=2823264 RepID=A0A8H5HZL7_9AGAR|nr:hypothetical protein D9757_003273 [Collybiopsis confluens]
MSTSPSTADIGQSTLEHILPWILTIPLTRESDHISSRPDHRFTLYSQHVPDGLRPLELGLAVASPSHSIQTQYASYLAQHRSASQFLNGEISKDLKSHWRRALQGIERLAVIDESGVVDSEKKVAEIVFDLASLAILDLSDKDIENAGRWAVFATRPSIEKETKTDILLGLQSEDKLDHPLWAALKKLKADNLKDIMAIECKNLLFGPTAFLTILLLSRFITESPVAFWPTGDCTGCTDYRASHLVLDRVITMTEFPLDSPISYGQQPASDEVVKEEIVRLIRLIFEEDEYGAAVQRNRPNNSSPFYNALLTPMTNFLWGLDAEELLLDVMSWVPRVQNIFIQLYSQMLRHNLTFGILSTYNNSILVERHRESRKALFSHILQPDRPESTSPNFIIQRTVWLLDALNDAVERCKVEGSNWPREDPYRPRSPSPVNNFRSASPASQDGGDKDSDYDPDKDEKAKGKTKAKAKANARFNPLPDPSKKGGPGGKGPGPGGAGGAGGFNASGSQTRTYGGSSHSQRKRTTSSGETEAKQDRQKRKKHSELEADLNTLLDIAPNHLHLGFNCLSEVLLSPAFSSYHRQSLGSYEASTPDLETSPRPHGYATPPRPFSSPEIGHSPEDSPDQQRVFVRGSFGSFDAALHRAQGSIASIESVGTASESSSAPSSAPSSQGTNSRSLGGSTPPSSPFQERNFGKHAADGQLEGQAPSTSVSVITHAGAILEEKIAVSTSGEIIIWGGGLILEDIDDAGNQAVQLQTVVKLADWETNLDIGEKITSAGRELLHEARVYERLSRFAPDITITPNYFGVFECDGSIALVLEHAGAPLDSLETLSDDEKRSIFTKVETLHNCGISHNRLGPNKFLRDDDGSLRVIGFGKVDTGHICEGRARCAELKAFGMMLNL